MRKLAWMTAAMACVAVSCDSDRITALERRVEKLEAQQKALLGGAGQGQQVAVAPAARPAQPAPAARPAPQPAAKPAPKPAAKPAPKPVAKPAPKPAAKPAPKPAAKPAPKPVAKPAPKPAAQPAPKPAAKPAPKPAAQPAPKPAAKPAPKPAAKAAGGKGICKGMSKVERRNGAGSFYMDKCEYPGHGKPKGNVSYTEAKDLCKARGARLCTVEEFERACMGARGYTYPYGVEYEPSHCHLPERATRSIEVGTRPGCTSDSWQVYDLIGNVAEWVDSDKGGVTCGGSFWTANGEGANCRRHYCSEPNKARWSFIGFRCCSDTAPR